MKNTHPVLLQFFLYKEAALENKLHQVICIIFFVLQKALITAKNMLELWKCLHEGQTSSDVPECDRKSDTRSVFQLYTNEMSDKDSSKS